MLICKSKQQKSETCYNQLKHIGLDCTRMSLVWILLEPRMTEMVVTTGAIRCAKLQSNHHHQQTSTQYLQDGMPFLLPNQQCQSTEGKALKFLL